MTRGKQLNNEMGETGKRNYGGERLTDEDLGETGKRNYGGERLTDEDLLTEVLSRLPVKYLLRCKAVSKTWYSLISTPNFIKSHYLRGAAITSNRAVDDNNEATTLIVNHVKNEIVEERSEEEDGEYLLFQLGDVDDIKAHLKFPFSRGDYPFLPPSLLVGCVHGIVCVCVDPSAPICKFYCSPTSDRPFHIYIWNPATRQSKLIPAHTLQDSSPTTAVALGFGFDPIAFDFKVVRVVDTNIFPEVYSANRDAWRNIEAKLTDVPWENKFDICLHGFLFARGFNGMIALNLNKEVFICDIKLPISSNDFCECYDARIADFRDSVTVITSKYEEPIKKFNLWTLDDEACLHGGGVEASWTLMLSIDVVTESDYKVVGIFNNVEFLLRAPADWSAYNSDEEIFRGIDYDVSFEFDNAFEYTESQLMLLVEGSKLVNWSDDENISEES